MARGRKVGRPKKKSGPSSVDVVQTKSMDAILGVSELEVQENDAELSPALRENLQTPIVEDLSEWTNTMDQLSQSVDLGTCSKIPILRSGDVKTSVATAPMKSKVKITQEDIAEEVNFWVPSIVGYVAGANPPLNVFEGFARRIWGEKLRRLE